MTTFKEEFADVSVHNPPVDNRYTRRILSIRACDGTFRDLNWSNNSTWCRNAKTLVFFFVYSVHPRSEGFSPWRDVFATLVDMLHETFGDAHIPNLVLTDDVETWSRLDLHKDFSESLEAKRQAEVHELNRRRPEWQRNRLFGRYYRWRDEHRVGGYGNRSDLAIQAGDSTKVRWRWIILADYTPDSPTPKTFNGWKVRVRQHTNGSVGDLPHGSAPFGRCDMSRPRNPRTGARRLARRMGLGRLRWSLH